MKLIVGLGNPGAKYKNTRHNIGFDVVAAIAKQNHAGAVHAKFQGEVVEIFVGGDKVLLLCPHTYMNNSGRSVRAATDFFKLTAEDILVICDDFNLDMGKLRFRAKGSSGGQKGLADIINKMGVDAVARLRIGIGAPPPHWDVPDYVLSKFAKEEGAVVDEMTDRAAKGATDWVRSGIEYCMNQYNA